MSGAPERIQTRPKNINQHPGLVISKRKRRTQAEMDEERAKENQEMEAKKRVHEGKLRRIADLEDDLAAKDLQAQEETAGTRPRLPRNKSTRINRDNIEDNNEHTIGDQGPVDISSGEGTDDAYIPDHNSTTEDSVDSEEEPPDKPPVKKQKRIQKSEARDAIKAYRQGPASNIKGEGLIDYL
jgi:hypothetical protein